MVVDGTSVVVGGSTVTVDIAASVVVVDGTSVVGISAAS